MKWKKIGDILVLDKFIEDLHHKKIKQLAKDHKVKTIIKINKINGIKREPTIELIYGDDTETIHKENGCLFNLDLSKVMWSKGNTSERLRMGKIVEDNEIVIDMFAGIGYFSLPIAVHSNPKKIYSIEINPNSFYYLKKNIKLNKIDNMIPILGDSKEKILNLSADRIIMGYVKTTHYYLKRAIESLNEGGILHYHETVPEKLMYSRPQNRIKKLAKNREVKILNTQKIKHFAPGVLHVVVDAKII